MNLLRDLFAAILLKVEMHNHIWTTTPKRRLNNIRCYLFLRPPSGNFDSIIRNRYFPGGHTPDGLDSDIMFKNMGDSDHFSSGDLRDRARRESEEMITDNRYRKILTHKAQNWERTIFILNHIWLVLREVIVRRQRINNSPICVIYNFILGTEWLLQSLLVTGMWQVLPVLICQLRNRNTENKVYTFVKYDKENFNIKNYFYLGSKLSAQDLSIMQRNIKNENSETEH